MDALWSKTPRKTQILTEESLKTEFIQYHESHVVWYNKIPLCWWPICHRNSSLTKSCSCVWSSQDLGFSVSIGQLNFPQLTFLKELLRTLPTSGDCRWEVEVDQGSLQLISLCFTLGPWFLFFSFIPSWITNTFLISLRIKCALSYFNSLLAQLTQRQRQPLPHITQNLPMNVYLSFLQTQHWSGIGYLCGLVAWHFKFGFISW